MHLIQNMKRKSFARKTMILLAAIMLGATAATDALAAGHVGGGGGHIGGEGFGGGHIGGGFGSGHVGGGFGSGFAGRSLDSERMGGHAGAFVGYPGATDFHSTRMGGSFHDGDHRLRERFAAGLYGYVPGNDDFGYSDYEYDGLGDYAGDTACFRHQQVYTTAGRRWRQVWVCN